MRLQKLVAATAVAAMLFTPALAATGRDCASLTAKVDEAVTKYSTAPNIEKAKVEQKKGTDFCAAGEFNRGLLHLKLALAALGVI